MFRQRIVILFPTIQRPVAQEAGDIIGICWGGMIEESSFRELRTCQNYESTTDTRDLTISAERDLCGHFMDLGAFVLAFEVLRLETGCAVWKEATRLSYVKYSLAISLIAMTAYLQDSFESAEMGYV